MSVDAAIPGIVITGRRVLEQYQLDRVFIQDRVVTRTSGGTSETWVERTWQAGDEDEPLFTEIGDPREYGCRFGQVTGFGKITDKEPTLVLDAIIQEKSSQAIQFPVDVEIDEQDRLRQPDGKLWTVVADLTPKSVLKLMVRVVVREI